MISASGTGVTQDTITISPITNTAYTYNFSNLATSIPSSGGTYSISTDTITLNGINASQFAFNFPREWVDSFPDFNRVDAMCKKYPGLKIAFDNFKVFYEMVKDDYDNPTPKK